MTLAEVLSLGKRWFTAIIIIIVWWIVAFIIAKTIAKLIIRQQGDHDYSVRASEIIAQIIRIVVMVFVLLFAIQSAGLDVALLIGWLTFAIWYAMQETLGNLMAGLLLLTNPKYKLWLLMQFLGDVGTFGTLESITLRNCIIRWFDKQAMIVPNMKVLSTPMKTFKMEKMVRYKITINIPRKAPIEKLQELIKLTVNKHQYVIEKEQTTVLLEEFTAQGIQLAVYFFYNPQCGYSAFKTRSEIRHNIHEVFKTHKITIPFPRTLLETSKL